MKGDIKWDSITRHLKKKVTESLDNALDRLDIEGLVTDAIHSKVDKVDIDPILEDYVKEIIEDELNEFDLEGEILSAMQDIL